MSGFGNVMKNGWHPKGKDGGRESWRGDFKGINQVAGWMGKGKEQEQQRSDHVSRPLATLKDPASFGPPPKNVNFHGGAAVPDRITPDRRGLGAPLAQPPTPARQQVQEEPQQSRPAPPPVPYRADTTGLSTSNLPPPPSRRTAAELPAQDVSQAAKPKPLPPRLPSRTQSTTSAAESDPPPAYEPVNSPSPISLPPSRTTPSSSTPQLNHGAISRLGNAGVSVPGFGIGRQQTSDSTSNGSQLSELQSRFAKMNNAASPQSEAAPSSQPPTQGTTWAQKQQAVQTAQSFHRDPSSVNAQDARQAASTVNNFRERHSDQIQARASRAHDFNKKHNITGRINSFLERQASGEQVPQQQQQPVGTNATTAAIERKPPPPPPPKKPANMHTSTGAASSLPVAPPIPLGTKPR